MKPLASTRVFACLVAVLALAGTACSSTSVRPARPRAPSPAEVTGLNLSDLERELDETPVGDPSRAALRDAVTRYRASRGLEAALSGDVDAALRHLRAALVHHTPAELARGSLPNELAPLARAVLETASSRGDEAHALAAARVLTALQTPDPGAPETFRRIRAWGSQNRQEFQRPWVRAGELAEIFKEVARIIPATDVLDQAAEYIVERRRAASAVRGAGGDAGRLNFDEMRQLQAGLRNAPADLAIVYLRVGDVQSAADRLTRLGGSAESGLGSALSAIAQGEGGAESLADLAGRLERIDAGAAAGVCRLGRRSFPTDARFAQCLAVAAAREHDLGLASAHLESAATLAPGEARTLQAAVAASVEWLQRETGADDPAAGRRAYARAQALLERWRAEHPRQAPPVAPGDLEEAAAQLELGSGNLAAAQAHLERATRAGTPSREAFYTLAELAWRHGDGAAATRYLREGLALPLRPNESDSVFRPQFTVRLALAARAAHDDAAARRLFEEAASALDAVARSTTGHDLAVTQLFRAVVADALGDTARVRPALNAAMDAAPESRDVAARAVTFALSHGMWSDARDLDRVARAQLVLDRTWQVYFALWGAVAARLGRLEDDGGARALLESSARSATAMSPWTVRLAQRYAGDLEREALLRFVKTTGQRAEALFYDGMLRLAAGDVAGAEADLTAVLQTETLRYFEYDMAWEMLKRRVRAAAPTPPTTMAAP